MIITFLDLLPALAVFWTTFTFNVVSGQFDEYNVCGGAHARNGRQYHILHDLQCDLSKQTWCETAGNDYPSSLLRRFILDNQGLMKRMYGDQRERQMVAQIFIDEMKKEEENIRRARKIWNSKKRNSVRSQGLMQVVFQPSNEKGRSKPRALKDSFQEVALNLPQDTVKFQNTAPQDQLPRTTLPKDSLDTILTHLGDSADSTEGELEAEQTFVQDVRERTEINVESLPTRFPTASEEASWTTLEESVVTSEASTTAQPSSGGVSSKQGPTSVVFSTSPEESRPANQVRNSLPVTPTAPSEVPQAQAPSRPDFQAHNAEGEELLIGGYACPMSTKHVQPFWANNTQNQLRGILNIFPFEQYVQIDTCLFENKQMYCRRGCRCEQTYRMHRMLSFDPHSECRGVFADWFKFPSSCVCKCYDARFFQIMQQLRQGRKLELEDEDYEGIFYDPLADVDEDIPSQEIIEDVDRYLEVERSPRHHDATFGSPTVNAIPQESNIRAAGSPPESRLIVANISPQVPPRSRIIFPSEKAYSPNYFQDYRARGQFIVGRSQRRGLPATVDIDTPHYQFTGKTLFQYLRSANRSQPLIRTPR